MDGTRAERPAAAVDAASVPAAMGQSSAAACRNDQCERTAGNEGIVLIALGGAFDEAAR
ncbi:hypothetical protein [Nitrobacter sp.]|uniref:hypothetical protein n=1 Tax=Nitrobacter sp. TaxID=29420 RepID=UPI00399D74FF